MLISAPLPMLNTSPTLRGSLTSAIIADTTSPTHVKLRVCAVAVHGDRLPCKRLPHEVRNHHAVPAALAGPDGVEEAHDDDRHLVLLPIGEREELVEQLAGGVSPAGLCRRAEHEVGVLAERQHRALAVDLRRGGDDRQFALRSGSLAETRSSVPWTLVSIVWTGALTTSRTPTAAARWNTTSHWSTSFATNGSLVTESTVHENPGHAARWAMFSSRPVDRSSSTATSWPGWRRASARCDPMNPAPPVIKTRMKMLLPRTV